jgi:alanyl-tRNA synthetase
VALTGDKAREYLEQSRAAVQTAAEQVQVAPSQLVAAVRQLLQTVRDLKKELTGGGKAAQSSTSLPPAAPLTSESAIRQALRDAARLLNVPLFEVPQRVAQLLGERQELSEQLERRAQQGGTSVDDLLAGAEQLGDVRLIVAEVPLANGNLLRQLVDRIRQACSSSAVLLGTVEGEDRVTLVAGVSRDLQSKLSAGDWVKTVAPRVGGGGGGKPDMAQAGGKAPDQLPAALELALHHARSRLSGSSAS